MAVAEAPLSQHHCENKGLMSVFLACLLKSIILMQVQGSDSSGDNVANNNVVAIEVSQYRTVLSILQADLTNSGPYQCTATSELDSEVVTASVDIVII